MTPVGDLTINCGSLILNVFVDSSLNECWRAFKPGDESTHFVVGGEDGCLGTQTVACDGDGTSMTVTGQEKMKVS